MVKNGKIVNLELKDVSIPSHSPFPYTPEKFTPKEITILLNFFTNWDKPVFAIHNLPQEVIGAMFSRYSRATKTVRRLFLDEFFKDAKIGKGIGNFDLSNATERTKNFYKRVFAEYGDDSVIQMGSVHIAFEYVSQIVVKVIEDNRVASAYIEKSTRYVDFGNKVSGRFLFVDIPELKGTQFEKEVYKWNNLAFKYYIKSYPTTFRYFKKRYPLKDQVFVNPDTGLEVTYRKIKNPEEKEIAKKAYERALRARSFDAIRLFLPITMVSNLGAHFSGQAAENCVNKMLSSEFSEVRQVGAIAAEELNKISPNFMQHINHRYGEVQRQYKMDLKKMQGQATEERIKNFKFKNNQKDVTLVDFDKDPEVKIASQIIYTNQRKGLSKSEIIGKLQSIKRRDLRKKNGLRFSPTLVQFIKDAIPDRKKGLNRRHKLPRAFEQVYVEVEFLADYGVYKDLQRNRISSTERQPFLSRHVRVPKEYKDKGMEKVYEMYKDLDKMTKDVQTELSKSSEKEIRNTAEYLTLHGSLVRFNIKANLRQWVFFAELRTIEGGHPAYRNAMQKAVKEIIKVYPFMKRYFAHVNWTKDTGLGRLRAEVRTQEKLNEIADTRF